MPLIFPLFRNLVPRIRCFIVMHGALLHFALFPGLIQVSKPQNTFFYRLSSFQRLVNMSSPASSFAAAESVRAMGMLRARHQAEMHQMLRKMYIGKPVSAIPTPSLVIDADAADANKATIEKLVTDLRKSRGRVDLRIRPHAKLHKSRVLAERILTELEEISASEGGSIYAGVCVQKVSEAEFLSGYLDAEDAQPFFTNSFAVRDIFISNEVGTAVAAARIAALHAWMTSKNTNGGASTDAPFSLSTCVDSVDTVRLLAEALTNFYTIAESPLSSVAPLSLFIEVNIGQRRGGARVCEDALHPVVDAIFDAKLCDLPLFRLQGLHAYHGGAQHIRCPRERGAAMEEAMAKTSRARDIIEARVNTRIGTKCGRSSFTLATITGAGTGTFAVAEGSSLSSAYNELQPGSYYVMDRDYLENNKQQTASFLPAMYIKSSVVSKTPFSSSSSSADNSENPARIVVDSGHKSSAIDSGLPCLAPWQLKDILQKSGGLDANGRVFSSECLVECSNGGDDHGLFVAGQLKFVRIQGGAGAGNDKATSTIENSPEMQMRVSRAIVDVLSMGDSVWLIPGHCDPTFNLHDFFFIVRRVGVNTTEEALTSISALENLDDAIIEDVGMVDARGCQQ